MKKGIFCISIDTELLWGRKNNLKEFISRAKKERVIIKQLLELFNKYNTPATWAIVGELFFKFNKNIKNDNLWHAEDIVKDIKKTKKQEIACHSFTHPVFDQISEKQAEKEIKNCLDAAEKLDVNLKSFVFPKNRIKHLNILEKYNFTNYRGLSKHQNKFPQLFDLFLPIGQVSKISTNNELLNIPATMYYLSTRGIRKFIPIQIRVFKAKLGIKKAIKNGKLFHLWFHPTDLTDNPNGMILGLEKIIKYAVKMKNKNKLEIKSMGEISSEFFQK